jgi:hypothetical protein
MNKQTKKERKKERRNARISKPSLEMKTEIQEFLFSQVFCFSAF